jgi:HTH-type transcriptional regulator, quorum sensing regulator NprR
MMTFDKPLNLEGLAPIVGLRIREARTDKGMSQKDLVGERFSKSYISSIERGKITPSLKALEYIARRLELSVAYLLTGVHPGANDNGVGLSALLGDQTFEADAPPRWDALLTEARILHEQGQNEQSQHLLSTKIRVRQLSTEQLKVYHFLQAQIALAYNDDESALSELEIVRELAEKTGDQEHLARLRQLAGTLYTRQGKIVQAIEQSRQALAAVENGTVRDLHFKLTVYNQLGALHRQLGDDREAAEMYQHALHLADDCTNPAKLAGFYWQTALTYRDAANLPMFKSYAAKSQVLLEILADMRMLTHLRSGYGALLLESRRYDEAEAQFKQARQLAADHSERIAHTIATMYLTDLYLEQNRLDDAQRCTDELAEDLSYVEPNIQGQVLSSRAALLTAQGKHAEAIRYFQQAVELLEKSDAARDLLSRVYFRYARALSASGEAARAAEMFERAYYQLGRPALVAER